MGDIPYSDCLEQVCNLHNKLRRYLSVFYVSCCIPILHKNHISVTVFAI